ncbi:MAG: GNAT family N-acetyltransferase [Candidatus Raymondbacteria bacterium RifOxyA12_full_50_37]|uniref:GNAT family N-acetyltransferase n=1 Tax=Candidatus Raymondbacteria bacterium RIFOXYD12_FULL_49_13 TaxID=1817890 RepID=A0A1F7F2Z8_UNCRA|nr:MAG: GNAT family N-acetyltransferase [Candidatus Raymondbacteria bacterium RifOxyA12_full_50_37]OGJ92814.1 MAG: GNAT family N-acetyltransferase [Candidatus Raymondbacteria bacterium RIFOXYA2_FULL_49_16]OGK00295.1 MAG: GNAT family N-acetyltransferase [Candidatus Raymondbacteria bacterium RifOxyB12_full_50_8]OGK01011.1 MAG: GNAT family N-acetyltransferase [Candidatus Raymondbacteria bacterium RIFOXYD12_FULL_49_13]OGK02470.1 MAG: GNAT family N-acetyltransferase [Candidatus Raymondbacteria bacte
MNIIAYDNLRHRDQVICLWQNVFNYTTAYNAPGIAIDKKIQVADGLFFVALQGDTVIGTVMAGYDGHRGWIYSLAVLPVMQKQGVGAALLKHAELALAGLGCVKINLQVIQANKKVLGFYVANGYTKNECISMGKVMHENLPKKGL